MTSFSDIETCKLVDSIGKHPILYDSQSTIALGKDEIVLTRVRDNIWKSIAESLGKSVPECRKKWKLVRDCYNRFKRKQRFSTVPTEPAKNSKWRLYERLTFLENTTQNEQSTISKDVFLTTSPIEIMEVKEEPHFFDDALSLDVVPTPGTPTPSDSSKIHSSDKQTRRKSRRKRPYDNLDLSSTDRHVFNEQEPMHALASNHQPSCHQSFDEIASFSKYVEMTLRKFGEQSRYLAKSEIFNVICKYEMKDLAEKRTSFVFTSSSSNTSTPDRLD